MMKTTVELDDQLLRRIKQYAAAEGMTIRRVLELATQAWLDDREPSPAGYVLRDASVGGGQINAEFLPWHWDKVRDLAYEDREL